MIRWLVTLWLVSLMAVACSDDDAPPPICGSDNPCPNNGVCIWDDGALQATCANPCGACDAGETCQSCFAPGDCPTCKICLEACR